MSPASAGLESTVSLLPLYLFFTVFPTWLLFFGANTKMQPYVTYWSLSQCGGFPQSSKLARIYSDKWFLFLADTVSEIFWGQRKKKNHCDSPVNLLNTAVNYEPEKRIYHPRGPYTTGKYFIFESKGLLQLIRKPSCLSLAFFLNEKSWNYKISFDNHINYLTYCYTEFLIKIMGFFVSSNTFYFNIITFPPWDSTLCDKARKKEWDFLGIFFSFPILAFWSTSRKYFIMNLSLLVILSI